MTSLAYLHDCHCCYNERSNVQKKTTLPLRWPLMLNSMTACKPPMLQWAVTLNDQEDFIGSEYRKLQRLVSFRAMVPGKTFLLFAKMC